MTAEYFKSADILDTVDIKWENIENTSQRVTDMQLEISDNIYDILSWKSDLTDDLVKEIAWTENDKKGILIAEKILWKNISPELSEKLIKIHEVSDAKVFEQAFADNRKNNRSNKSFSYLRRKKSDTTNWFKEFNGLGNFMRGKKNARFTRMIWRNI
jgi:hypothetical protein